MNQATSVPQHLLEEDEGDGVIKCYWCEEPVGGDYKILQCDEDEEYKLCEDCLDEATEDDRKIALIGFLAESEGMPDPFMEIDEPHNKWDQEAHLYKQGRYEYRVLTEDEAEQDAADYARNECDEFALSQIPETLHRYFDVDEYVEDNADVNNLGTYHGYVDYYTCAENGTDWVIARTN